MGYLFSDSEQHIQEPTTTNDQYSRTIRVTAVRKSLAFLNSDVRRVKETLFPEISVFRQFFMHLQRKFCSWNCSARLGWLPIRKRTSVKRGSKNSDGGHPETTGTEFWVAFPWGINFFILFRIFPNDIVSLNYPFYLMVNLSKILKQSLMKTMNPARIRNIYYSWSPLWSLRLE